jgi:predicted exporter
MPDSKRLLLILWLASLLLGGSWLAATLRPQADLSLFLPHGGNATQQLLLNELHRGKATRLLLIGISGGDAEGRADLSQGLVAALRQNDRFERVENGAPSDMNLDPQLLRYRYLLTPADRLAQSLTTEALHQALAQRLDELNSPLPNPFKSLLPSDPSGAFQHLLMQWQPQQQVARQAGVWSSQAGDMAILLALTAEGGLALDRQARAVADLRADFARLNRQGTYRLTLTGPGAFGVLSKQLIESDSRWLSLLASAAIALLLLLAYRHLPYLLYAALPLLSALLAATLLTHLLFDSLHGITLAFGITLLGVTLDYPIHLFSHLSDEERPARTMQRIWPTLRLGVITTCLGYFVLITTDFSGLRQLGVFTLSGLLTAALTSRYLLPRLLNVSALPPPQGQRLLGFMTRRHWLPTAVMGAITLSAALSLGLSPQLWNDDIAVLSPLSPALLAQDRFLRQQLQAQESNQMLLLNGRDMPQLLQQCEALRPLLTQAVADGLTAGATLPCDYLPSASAQRASQAAIPASETLSERLRQALEGLPFRTGAFAPFLEALQASRQLKPLSYEALRNNLLRQRLDSLLRPQAEGWLALVPLRQVNQGETLAKRLQAALPGVQYVDLRQATSQLIGGFRQEVLGQSAAGFLVMLAVLWIGLGSFRRAIGILLPIAIAILADLALLRLLGGGMNLFHLISLMLVLGIGIDFSLFFSRQSTTETERQRTLHALTLCALSTVSVFAILGSSGIPVLHAIGQTVAIGVSLSYLATYAFWHMPWNPLRDHR